MARRIFISFAIEDRNLRDFMIGHRNNIKSNIDFVDMSVKSPWDSAWKTNCRSRIRGCDGVVGIVTKNSKNAEGQLWELKCAYDEGVPVLLIYGNGDNKPSVLPPVIRGKRVYNWTWDRVSDFIGRL